MSEEESKREFWSPPEFPVFITGEQACGFCSHCYCWHIHGWPSLLEGEDEMDRITHRLAHCHVDASPYRESGYFLKPIVDTSDLPDIARVRTIERLADDVREVKSLVEVLEEQIKARAQHFYDVLGEPE